ncbi:MAG: SGNH/GDSL hydrolase family protein [Proteobacteria bacterium]|nr:SGNH/GDSL hydrolase family protein [Pseudomonadota bacterium]
MTLFDLAGRATKSLAAVLFVLIVPVAAPAEPSYPKHNCDTPRDLMGLGGSLSHVARKIERRQPVTIVAIGSSSTAGAGASSPAASYPSRLAVELRAQFPSQQFNVINQGVNGEEVPDMLKRFDAAIVAQKPDLVLWQLGTNSLIRDHAMTDRGAAIRSGLNRIRAVGADVILIDPQYAPKVIAKPLAPQMVDFIASVSKQEDVGLFRRFEAMKRWNEDGMPFSAFTIADGLHMNDWGYACMAHHLGVAIAEAVKRPIVSAKATAATR